MTGGRFPVAGWTPVEVFKRWDVWWQWWHEPNFRIDFFPPDHYRIQAQLRRHRELAETGWDVARYFAPRLTYTDGVLSTAYASRKVRATHRDLPRITRWPRHYRDGPGPWRLTVDGRGVPFWRGQW